MDQGALLRMQEAIAKQKAVADADYRALRREALAGNILAHLSAAYLRPEVQAAAPGPTTPDSLAGQAIELADALLARLAPPAG